MTDHLEEFEDEQEPDQTVTYGYIVPAIDPSHWSLSPEWKKAKEGMNDTATVPAPTEQVPWCWYAFAACLAGRSADEENV